MAEKNKNNKDSQKGQVTPKKYFFFKGRKVKNQIKTKLKAKFNRSYFEKRTFF